MKFSIVTPTYNSEKYLNETIQSVISQKGNFTIEYIIIDNYSEDNTINIIKKYQYMIQSKNYPITCKDIEIKYYQAKDNGMYDAINKGFLKAKGDIYAWINSDDIYLPGAFSVIRQIFIKYPEIKWLKGITSYINELSTIYKVGNLFLYDQFWIKMGIYGKEAYFIQQDSVFWRAGLWKISGGIDTRFKKAGDYYLWIKFSNHTPLYSVKAYISCFRKVKGQISQYLDSYKKEYDIINISVKKKFLRKKIKYYFSYSEKINIRILNKILYRVLFGRQKLSYIDIINGGKPVLKKNTYYLIT